MISPEELKAMRERLPNQWPRPCGQMRMDLERLLDEIERLRVAELEAIRLSLEGLEK